MDVRRLGRTDFEVKRIGFGGMTIPQVGVEQAVETVTKALDLGVNFLDTARVYGRGDSERKIGLVMRERRGECYLSSRSPEVRYEAMKSAVEESLEALNTDYIDLYEAHDVSSRRRFEQLISKDGALRALQEARDEGKIGYIGFTAHNWEVIKELIRTNEFDAGLITYNIASREVEEEVIELAGEYDVGLFVMKVFGNGRLLELSPPDEDRKPTVEECLRFALSNKELPLILTGAKSPAEIAQNVAIAQNFQPMSDEKLRQIREFGDRLQRGYCYGCEYCLPCPEDINIPAILRVLEYHERISWEHPQARKAYAEFEKTIEDCADCEQCEERCPQNLPVRSRLKEAHEELSSDP